MKLKYFITLCFCSFLLFFSVLGQYRLSLDSCRQLALKNNKELKISSKEIQIAKWQKELAKTHFLPKFSALGTYMRSEKEMMLLSDEQKHKLRNLGKGVVPKLQKAGMGMAMQYPQFAPIIQGMGKTIGGQLVPALGQLGSSLVEGLRTDTRNLYVGAVNVTQPLYVGGKIRAYSKITDYLVQIAEQKHKLSTQELLLQTEEAYWRVVSLSNKKKLADSYVKLLAQMDGDVEKMIAEGVATKADGLTVKVKRNEAEILQTKAENGVVLSKMVLAQLCGLPISSQILLDDEKVESIALALSENGVDKLQLALKNRPEICSLSLASQAKKEKVKIERSEFLPQVAFMGNYMITNPSSFNGFENKFGGMWTLGVQMKIPIFHWGEGWKKVKIAKQEAEIITDKLEEAKEKISLQVHQAKFRLEEAQKQVLMTGKNVEKAEENLRYAKLGFSEGVIPSSVVLKAHTAWFDAQSQQIDAQISLKLSRVFLEKALGTLHK